MVLLVPVPVHDCSHDLRTENYQIPTEPYSFNPLFLASVPFSYSLVEGDTLPGLSYEMDFENVDKNWQKPAASLGQAKYCNFLSKLKSIS
jgi:hypothetical protein